MNIFKTTADNYPVLIDIWEASVRATHEFLSETHIQTLKPLILAQYFDAVDLRIAKTDKGDITGFIGVADQTIEMLFMSPEYRAEGIGSLLLEHAVTEQAAYKVDVNEQNQDAVGFYQHAGFCIVGRSAFDGQGNPFPLLHMELSNKV